MMTRLAALAVLVFTLALPLVSAPVSAKDPVYTSTFSSVAVSGYDPVAYFNQGKPVEGSSDHEFEWNGATWRFVTAANLETFRKDPEAYAPQYGGYCAWAVSQGYTASTDPTAWRIVDGKLYLNYSHSVLRRWEQDIAGNIVKGDVNWPKVLE